MLVFPTRRTKIMWCGKQKWTPAPSSIFFPSVFHRILGSILPQPFLLLFQPSLSSPLHKGWGTLVGSVLALMTWSPWNLPASGILKELIFTLKCQSHFSWNTHSKPDKSKSLIHGYRIPSSLHPFSPGHAGAWVTHSPWSWKSWAMASFFLWILLYERTHLWE